MTQHLSMIRQIVERTLEYPFKVWGFGEGIALEAVWQAAVILDTPDYQQRVAALVERWLSRPLQEADHSAPGGLLLDFWEASGEQRYLEHAELLAAYMNGLPRANTGALFHRPTHPEYHDFLYVDCMEVDAPFLCRLAEATQNASYFERAVEQLLSYAALLQDDTTHLFYHQYDSDTRTTNGVFWGRGCGWALLGMLKTLRYLPSTHVAYAEIKQRFRSLVDALIARQRPDGEWTTVIDHAEMYVEGSLAAMFHYGIEQGIRTGLLSPAYQPASDAAWAAVQRRMSSDGLLKGVSIATPPGKSAVHYHAIPVHEGFPWGQGAALLTYISRLKMGSS
jgi:unsaturated rhamnogalacturonyl hydrolase